MINNNISYLILNKLTRNYNIVFKKSDFDY